MNITLMFTEFVIIGLVPLLALIFLSLSFFGIYSLGFLLVVNGFSAMILVGFLLASYLLGAVSYVSGRALGYGIRLLRLKLRNRNHHSLQTKRDVIYERWSDYFVIYQYGSSNLISLVENGKSILRIFRSATVTLPMLGISLYLWLVQPYGMTIALVGLMFCITMAVMSFLSFLAQNRSTKQLISIAVQALESDRQKAIVGKQSDYREQIVHQRTD